MAMTNDAAELEAFKRHPIHDLLPRMGWTLDAEARERGKDSHTWLGAGGEKITTFKGRAGSWMWKTFNENVGPMGKTCGTVIDVAIAGTGSLGKARLLLRSLTSISAPSSAPDPSHSSSTRPNPDLSTEGKAYTSSADVAADYATGTIWRHGDNAPSYLASRGLDDIPEQFSHSFAVDRTSTNRNIMFPYYKVDADLIEMGGVERKGRDFRGYTKNGRAGVWMCPGDAGEAWVITESPIDCMSYAVHASLGRAATKAGSRLTYAAVRSGSETDLAELILDAHADHRVKLVILATDNDAAGAGYACKIMSILQARKGPPTRMHMPLQHTDWNATLMASLKVDDTPRITAPELAPSM